MGSARRKMSDTRLPTRLNKTKKAIQKLTGATDVQIRTDLPQEEKISNALAVLLYSEVLEGSQLAEYRAALAFIAFAWNVSLLPAHQRAQEIQKLAALPLDCDAARRRDAAAHVERLIAKKMDLFPHDQRMIVSCEARFQGDRLHITAAALSSPANAPFSASHIS
jgi:hypothetical protein